MDVKTVMYNLAPFELRKERGIERFEGEKLIMYMFALALGGKGTVRRRKHFSSRYKKLRMAYAQFRKMWTVR